MKITKVDDIPYGDPPANRSMLFQAVAALGYNETIMVEGMVSANVRSVVLSVQRRTKRLYSTKTVAGNVYVKRVD